MPEPLDTSGWSRLNPNVCKLWRVQNLITALFLTPLAVFPFFILHSVADLDRKYIFIGAAAFFVVYVSIGQAVVGASYSRFRYRLSDDDLAVCKGVFWRSWRFVSRTRVQHIDVAAGPVARALGIVNVSIFVGGMPTAVASLPGLLAADGELLRSRLVHDDKPAPAPVSSPPPTQAPTL